MFENNKLDDLKNMYDIFVRVDGCKDHIMNRFTNFVLLKGTQIVTNKELIGEKKEEGKTAGP